MDSKSEIRINLLIIFYDITTNIVRKEFTFCFLGETPNAKVSLLLLLVKSGPPIQLLAFILEPLQSLLTINLKPMIE
jgi:hypothetical protein